MKTSYISTVLVLGFCILQFNKAAAAPIDSARRANDVAMKALEDCGSAWTHKGREEALNIINDRGTFLAVTLNPVSVSAAEHMALLDDVTKALSECTRITFSDS